MMIFLRLFILLLSITMLCSCEQNPLPSDKIDINTAAKDWNSASKIWNETELVQLEKGKRLYRASCAACHLSSGEGQQQTIGSPALKNNSIVKGKIEVLSDIILNGRNSMPAFADSINNNDLTKVISYIRNAWGNNSNSIVDKSTIDLLMPESN
ncbi:MAG: hypothetical protein DIZ80_08995 [endosymbiont of Galathealinum brachiosum]|uniref:Cytochrome c domain-containing protein n=1 Tax=endosymbiont of Galathealinum brachiosum TaxID=2200906 RepID=A0A370DBY4_9GAMM|nr:MAG: hypothetical protein DIZ80_08995 [endosymbiont of Galathealinum brachiosum]